MSNLSDLLPAGASAKQLTFTDSGSGISSKAPVILNSDGTVSGITSSTTTVGVGSNAVFESAAVAYVDNTYDTANDRVCVVYRDEGNSNYGTAVVGSISGKTITWGTPVVYDANTTTEQVICYDTNAGKVVIAYLDSNPYGAAIVGTIDPDTNSISFGAKAQFHTSSSTSSLCIAYDITNQKSMIGYTNNGSSYMPTAVVASISGTSVSFGTPSAFGVGITNYSNKAISYDSVEGKFIFAYTDGSNNGMAVAAAIAGTGVIIPTSVAYTSGQGYDVGLAYDVTADETIILFRVGPANVGAAVVASLSGYTLTFGTVNSFETADIYYPSPVYDSNLGKVVCVYSDSSTNIVARTATITGTNVALSAETVIHSNYGPYVSTSYDSTNKVILTTFEDSNNSDYGTGVVYAAASSTHPNLTAQAFVGVADSAISASAAGSIIVQGGTVTGPTADVVIAESLSSAFLYAQDGAADPVGSKASGTGSDNFLIAYEINDGVSRGALAQAATVTSGNISYGSSATIGGASTDVYYYSITYDSTNDKFVVFWRNQGNKYLYGAVVTLTGNSISYGATTAVYSAANYNGTNSFSSTYDPDTDRVILGVCDNADGYAYSVVIELGTTTIDTVGTPQKIDSASATAGYAKNIALCYDTTENKVIATYVYTGGGGSYYLRVAAGTTTGGATNSITWGSSSVVYSGDAGYASIAYNTTDQRVVIAYKQIADGKGYSSVATVSGTTVTANTPSAFFTDTLGGTLYYMGIAHDAYVNKMVIYARASQGDAFNGAIDTAANTITWGTKLDVSSDAYNPPQVVFNASTNQTILSGAGTTKATAGSFIYTVPGTVTGQPLTTGTKYYVTSTGTFSSSADTPSVNAGLAISTTSLLLNGDS